MLNLKRKEDYEGNSHLFPPDDTFEIKYFFNFYFKYYTNLIYKPSHSNAWIILSLWSLHDFHLLISTKNKREVSKRWQQKFQAITEHKFNLNFKIKILTMG